MGHPVTFQILLILHVVSALLLFAWTLGTPRVVREALASERSVGLRALQFAAAQGRKSGMAGIFLLLTGIGMIFSRGGFAAVGPQFHASLGLMLVALVIGGAVIRPTLMTIVKKAQAGDPSETIAPLAKRLTALGGIQHALFFTMLLLMLWRM